MATWIILMGWGARLVLTFLVLLSIWSVSIMIKRSRVFKAADDKGNLEEGKSRLLAKGVLDLKNWKPARSGIRQRTLLAAMEVGKASREALELRVRTELSQQRLELESGLGNLATLGSNAPFIGLFGTVLGIIQAFGALASENSSGTNQVMAALAEALVATAVGLLVAIPAVVAYNHFSQKLRVMIAEAEALKDLYLSKVLEERG